MSLRTLPQLVFEAKFELPFLVAAKPASELLAHISHFKIPSFHLLGRCIKVFSLAMFKWHLHDRILLLRPEALVCRLNGRVQVIHKTGREPFYGLLPHLYFTEKDLEEFNSQYPFLLQKASYYEVKVAGPEKNSLPSHKSKYLALGAETVVQVPDFADDKKLGTRSLTCYFREYHHHPLNHSKLLHSKNVKKIKSIDRILHFKRLCGQESARKP